MTHRTRLGRGARRGGGSRASWLPPYSSEHWPPARRRRRRIAPSRPQATQRAGGVAVVPCSTGCRVASAARSQGGADPNLASSLQDDAGRPAQTADRRARRGDTAGTVRVTVEAVDAATGRRAVESVGGTNAVDRRRPRRGRRPHRAGSPSSPEPTGCGSSASRAGRPPSSSPRASGRPPPALAGRPATPAPAPRWR